MKLKQQPEDFTVEEIPSLTVTLEKNAHTVFLLEKKELDTFEAIRLLSRRFQIPLFEIGYAGLKDKHALARQYVSIPSHFQVQAFKKDNMGLVFVGYVEKKIKVGDLLGNRFSITVRDIQAHEWDDIKKRAETIPWYGVPNYFDAQRFGSVFGQEFIAKFLIQQNYEAAVKQYLTAYLKSESRQIKNEKRAILAQWHALEKVTVRTKQLAFVLCEYQMTKDWCAAYKKISGHLREIHVNAYQSFLWNECVKEILRIIVDKKRLYPVEYPVGSLSFYNELQEDERQKIPDMFPTIGTEMILSSFEKQIVMKVLTKEQVKIDDFENVTATGNFFKPRRRPVVVIPEQFTISTHSKDELNDKPGNPRYKVNISFTLPKGCYATIVTKRIFNH